MHTRIDSSSRHADLAMQAARRLVRARRQSQKAKMGHAVCHHLLRMLSDNSGLTGPSGRGNTPMRPATRAKRLEDKQFSLSF